MQIASLYDKNSIIIWKSWHNHSKCLPLGYSVWLVLSVRRDYPIGNHLCDDSGVKSTAVKFLWRQKKRNVKKFQSFSGSLSFIYMHHIWYNQDMNWNYNWQCQLCLSLFVGAIGRNAWKLAVSVTQNKCRNKQSFKSVYCIFRTKSSRRSYRNDIWKHSCAWFVFVKSKM